MALTRKFRRISFAAVLALLPIAVNAQSFAYVANAHGNDVSMYTINLSTGALTPIRGVACNSSTSTNCVAAGSQPELVTVDPSGKFVYVTNNAGNDVSAYTINPSTGVLAPIPGVACNGTASTNCIAAGAAPVSVTVDPSGKFVYLVNNHGNDVSAYTINPSTGALTPIPGVACNGTASTNCVATGSFPFSITVDPSGKFAYVANAHGNDVSAYTINPSTGALTPIPGVACNGTASTNCIAAGDLPVSVTVDPSGKFVYVVNQDGNDVSAYTINPSTGALTPIPGVACNGTASTNCVATGSIPFSLTVDRSGKFVYLTNHLGNDVSAYTINPSTGALTPIPGVACNGTASTNCVAAGRSPFSITVDPSGKFVYVLNQNGMDVSAYTINPSTGALTPIPGVACNGAASTNCTAAAGAFPFSVVTVRLDRLQTGYAANLNIGDSVVNLSNDGSNGGVFGATPPSLGNICVNAYVFDPQEEEIGCCACLVTPDGLNSLSVKNDLISNPLTPAIPNSIVVSLVSSKPATDSAGALTLCNPATVAGATAGMLAWGTTLEPSSSSGTYSAVPVPFLTGRLSLSELNGLTQLCNFIQSNGTGYGICKSCRLGALGGSKK